MSNKSCYLLEEKISIDFQKNYAVAPKINSVSFIVDQLIQVFRELQFVVDILVPFLIRRTSLWSGEPYIKHVVLMCNGMVWKLFTSRILCRARSTICIYGYILAILAFPVFSNYIVCLFLPSFVTLFLYSPISMIQFLVLKWD